MLVTGCVRGIPLLDLSSHSLRQKDVFVIEFRRASFHYQFNWISQRCNLVSYQSTINVETENQLSSNVASGLFVRVNTGRTDKHRYGYVMHCCDGLYFCCTQKTRKFSVETNNSIVLHCNLILYIADRYFEFFNK